ncbi:MAG: thioredoxin domain-containing protein [Candidatus Thermoplasmatota archaeon]|nr:thioredoxin domain-containing protein [Candidatus Thermoplasmatota archaeon]
MNNSSEQLNHLKDETSPYLKQHKHNPVDWYPWSDEAFQKAKTDHKPIFLSIGYATCHWCHVMAHESFEDKEIAKILNNHYVCIKVDREERPEIDQIYMHVCQMLTGRGGWPLTIIMTPDKQPFFAATYLPKKNQYGMNGLLTLLPEIKKIWDENQEKIIESATEITKRLHQQPLVSQQTLDNSILEKTYDALVTDFDELHGGFGKNQKFPLPQHLLFLLGYWKATKQPYSLKMVTTTLKQMRQGGIFDHIGFGFHRYATERTWKIPHFEKMLYDQALLLNVYTEAYQATQNNLFKQTAEEIITYTTRNLTSSHGAFYAAEDADSEGKEGKYYTWTYEELSTHLTSEELKIASLVYSLKKEGNVQLEPGRTTENILYQSMTIKEAATVLDLSEKNLTKKLSIIRKKLFTIRSQRMHPNKDDQILTDWNGLMIASLAKAARTFHQPQYLTIAEQAIDHIQTHRLTKNNELIHSHRNKHDTITGYATDYAFITWAMIELYQTTFNPTYLQKALQLNSYVLNHFWDKTHGGFFITSDTAGSMLVRQKEIYDGSIPSANAIILQNLIRLAHITANPSLKETADQLSNTFSTQINTHPTAYTHFISAVQYMITSTQEIVIVGEPKNKDTKEILSFLQSHYFPHTSIILKNPKEKNSLLEELIPWIKTYDQIDQKTTVYICKNKTCQQPTTDLEKIKKELD